jgi:hypothetical protein
MKHFIFYDASGNIPGNGVTPDDTIPENALECTEEQYSNIGSYRVYWEQGTAVLANIDSAILIENQLAIDRASANAEIQQQIDALERGQARAVREATLGMDGAIDRLKTLDAKIATLRAQFIK